MTSDGIKTFAKYLGGYLLFYVIGLIVAGVFAAVQFDRPHPPEYLYWLLEDHLTFTTFMSFLILPVLGGLTCAVVVVGFGLIVASA